MIMIHYGGIVPESVNIARKTVCVFQALYCYICSSGNNLIFYTRIPLEHLWIVAAKSSFIFLYLPNFAEIEYLATIQSKDYGSRRLLPTRKCQ